MYRGGGGGGGWCDGLWGRVDECEYAGVILVHPHTCMCRLNNNNFIFALGMSMVAVSFLGLTALFSTSCEKNGALEIRLQWRLCAYL